jgi:nucleoside-diphosphate-sugar epimerase
MTRRGTVVGAAGFVGRRLKAKLETSGWEVFAPARGDKELFRRDLGVLFYCAGLTADYDARPFDTVEAHASLISELIRSASFERVVYTSSTRLYDGMGVANVAETQPLVLDPTDPRRVYDLSKALGENLTITRTGGRGAVARLSGVYHWGDEAPGFLSAWLIQAQAHRELTLESSPHVARDYIHLDDVVAALIALGESPEPAGIVNVASGELVTNAEIAQVFEEEGWHVSFSGQGRPLDPPNADVGKLKSLGVSPEGVKDVVRRYLRGLKA